MIALLTFSPFIIVLILLYYVTTKNFKFWKNKNVPYAKPLPLVGNFGSYIILKRFTSKITQDLCRQFPNEPYFGTFYGTEPALIVKDPELIKLVLTKDFYYFHSREVMEHATREVITQNLFFTYGDKWKVIRQNLTPLFSSAKMKNMFYLIKNCTYAFEKLLDYETGISNQIEVRGLMTRYTMDCVCTCAFGIETKTMDENPQDNVFLNMGKLIFSTSYLRGLRIIGRAMWPQLFYGLGFKTFPDEISDFFHNLLIGVFQSRGYEPTKRNDFVDLVLSLKKNKYIVGDCITNLKTKDKKKFQMEVDDDLLVSQCVVFFAAGFETSAGSFSLTLYELAKNQEAQKLAHAEVDEYLKKHNNQVECDCVTELPYLDACLSETLRLYPVLAVLTREVVEDYTLPGGLVLERGMRVHVPVYHVHRDSQHFPEPEKFKPERFLPEAKQDVRPYTYMPFGEGPRTCIGMRFAKMQILPGMVTFLKKYRVELAPGESHTFQHQTTTFILQPVNDIKLNVFIREGWENRIYKQ